MSFFHPRPASEEGVGGLESPDEGVGGLESPAGVDSAPAGLDSLGVAGRLECWRERFAKDRSGEPRSSLLGFRPWSCYAWDRWGKESNMRYSYYMHMNNK